VLIKETQYSGQVSDTARMVLCVWRRGEVREYVLWHAGGIYRRVYCDTRRLSDGVLEVMGREVTPKCSKMIGQRLGSQ